MLISAHLATKIKKSPHLTKEHATESFNKKHIFLYIFCGAIAGLTTSILGLGGSLIVTPLLVIKAHFPYRTAIKVAVIITVVTAFFSLMTEGITDNLPVHDGSIVAFATVIGTFFGHCSIRLAMSKTTYLILET